MNVTGPNNTLIEACCGSFDDVKAVAAHGVRRVELNSSLFLGGLTPTVGSVALVHELIDIEIVSMIRPREGGFMYSDMEFQTMLRDITALSHAGADAFVFGVLNPDGTIDMKRNRTLIEQADGKPCVFHRAFDVVPDRRVALEQLVELGFVRVLTTGGCADVREAVDHISGLIRQAGSRITVLPGGVKPYFAADFVRQTQATELHVAQFTTHVDPSCDGNNVIHFGGALHPSETRVSRFDGDWLNGFGASS